MLGVLGMWSKIAILNIANCNIILLIVKKRI